MSFDCKAEVERILELYYRDTSRLLALALARFDRFPSGVLNELRAAMTHMARAIHGSNLSDEQRSAQCKKAATHVDRATIDCLKVLVIVAFQDIHQRISARQKWFPLSSQEMRLYDEIVDLREQISVRETREGDSGKTRVEYMGLYVKLQDYHKSLSDGDGHFSLAAFKYVLGRVDRSAVMWGLVFLVVGWLLGQWGPRLPEAPWQHAAKPSITSSSGTTVVPSPPTP
jgi:hypothetical protein